jgi:hypothetical protein
MEAMTEDDRSRFAELMTMLAAAFREPLEGPRVAAYWAALDDLSIDAIEYAVDRTLRTCRFFPRPVELRDAAGAGVPDASLIETMLLAHLRQPGGERRSVADPFLRLVVDRLGGLHSVSGMDTTRRLQAIGRMLPALLSAALVRGIPMPSEQQQLANPERLQLVKRDKDSA